ncbi:MAG: hypothetical protein ACFFB3_09565 [Candidatus Hodarchaeota archaeon]
MDEQVKRIALSIMLVIDLLVIVYVATLGNLQLGADNGYLFNLDDRIFGLLPLLSVTMWLKLFADLYLGYFIARSFQESVGLLDKAIADANWFLKPGMKVSIACVILQFILVIFDSAFDDDHNLALDSLEFFANDVLIFTTIAEIFLLITLIALVFVTSERQ